MFLITGQYDVNDALLHQNVKVPLSSFKSKSIRRMQPDPAPVSFLLILFTVHVNV